MYLRMSAHGRDRLSIASESHDAETPNQARTSSRLEQAIEAAGRGEIRSAPAAAGGGRCRSGRSAASPTLEEGGLTGAAVFLHSSRIRVFVGLGRSWQDPR